MDREEALLHEILAHPSDPSPRLVFAGWLENQGDPRAEVVRLLHTLTQQTDPPDRPSLESRLRSLLESGVKPVGPFWTSSIGMKFACIPPGTFLMGSPPTEPSRLEDETQHPVTLTKGFYLGVCPVTQAQWRAVMGTNPSHLQGNDLPVEMVSWEDAQEFCRKLSNLEDRPSRLPTEAEWEYACRAGTMTPFYFGERISPAQANYDGRFIYGHKDKDVFRYAVTPIERFVENVVRFFRPSLRAKFRRKTTPVGSFSPNAFGLYDMHGNVFEWCEDWYGAYQTTENKDPVGPSSGQAQTMKMPGTVLWQVPSGRVMRGGAWCTNPRSCRSAHRNGAGALAGDYLIGFRVCLPMGENTPGFFAEKISKWGN